MLYNKLYAAAFSAVAFLASRSRGSVYYVQKSPHSNYQCTDSTTCHIYCNVAEPNSINQYNCSNTATCYFHCDEKKCGQNAWIYGNNASTLIILQSAAGEECLRSAHIVAPDRGNAFFASLSKRGFGEMTVYSGTQTNQIMINCDSSIKDKDDCQAMNVFASTAQYLSITIGNQLEFNNATVECPVDSTYEGPDAAPCVIDATNGVMTNIMIVAPEGTPRNAYIKGCSSCTNVQIQCNFGYSAYPFTSNDDCWNITQGTLTPTNPTKRPTNNPSLFPTIYPTIAPTIPPSKKPTVIPTKHPTLVPTIIPTVSPTLAPTKKPTAIPTQQPTLAPTKIPTFVPTIKPTLAPTIKPTLAPTIKPTVAPTKEPTVDPTKYPTLVPTEMPTFVPTINPTHVPTVDIPYAQSFEHSVTTFKPMPKNDDDSKNIPHSVLDTLIVVLIIVIIVLICVMIVYKLYLYKVDNEEPPSFNTGIGKPVALYSVSSSKPIQGTPDAKNTFSTNAMLESDEIELTKKDFGLSFDDMSTVNSSVGILATRCMESYNYAQYKTQGTMLLPVESMAVASESRTCEHLPEVHSDSDGSEHGSHITRKLSEITEFCND